MNATYLLMVTPEGNHNKFYRMLPNFPDDSHFTVEWGRVGATAIKKIYSMAAWDKKMMRLSSMMTNRQQFDILSN